MSETSATPSFSIVDAALAGPRLIRRKPMVFVTWAAFQLIASAAYAALLLLLFGPFFQALIDSLGKRTAPPPELFLSLIPRVGLALLVIIPLLILYIAMTRAAPARAFVRPEDDRFGYLRVSVEEWRVFAVIFVVGCIKFAVQMVLGIIGGLLALVLLGVTGGLDGGPLRQMVVNQAANLVVWPGLIFIYLKFALAVPETLDLRRISIFNSWNLTNGVTWRMFISYLIVFLISAVIVLIIIAAIAGVAVAGGFNLVELAQQFETDPAAAMRELFALFVPVTIIFAVVSAVVTPFFNALYLCPAAYIYRAVTGRTEDVFA